MGHWKNAKGYKKLKSSGIEKTKIDKKAWGGAEAKAQKRGKDSLGDKPDRKRKDQLGKEKNKAQAGGQEKKPGQDGKNEKVGKDEKKTERKDGKKGDKSWKDDKGGKGEKAGQKDQGGGGKTGGVEGREETPNKDTVTVTVGESDNEFSSETDAGSEDGERVSLWSVIKGFLVVMFALGILVLPVAMFGIGYRFANMCPGSPNLPKWLQLSGAFLLFQGINWNFQKCMDYYNEYGGLIEEDKAYLNPCYICYAVVCWVQFIWFIQGVVWLFGFQQDITNSLVANYCHPTIYFFALGLVLATFGAVLLIVLTKCVRFIKKAVFD